MYRILFAGTPNFSVPSLQKLAEMTGIKIELVLTQPARLSGRGLKSVSSPIKDLASELGLLVITPENLVREDFVGREFDLGVVVAYGKILPPWLLDLPKLGWINLHPSKLPKFRGPSPIQAAIASGEVETASTIIKLDEQMDHGPVVAQSEIIPIFSSDNYFTLSTKLASQGSELLASVILLYLAGDLTPVEQNHDSATYCKLIKKENGALDFTKTAKQIFNTVRAFSSWPGTAFNGLKILEVKISPISLEAGVLFIDKSYIPFVGTADQAVELVRVQFPGGRSLSGQELVRDHADRLGKIFELDARESGPEN